MEIQDSYTKKLERAKKRVHKLKGFYKHVKAYIIVNILLVLLRGGVFDYITVENKPLDIGFLNWISLNFLLTPVLWGIGLLIHGICVYKYKFTFLRKWEEGQIKKYIEKDKTNADKYK